MPGHMILEWVGAFGFTAIFSLLCFGWIGEKTGNLAIATVATLILIPLGSFGISCHFGTAFFNANTLPYLAGLAAGIALGRDSTATDLRRAQESADRENSVTKITDRVSPPSTPD